MAFSKRDFLLAVPAAVVASKLLCQTALAADNKAGEVSRLSGPVMLVRGGAENTVAVGQEVLVNDSIQVGADGRAEIIFIDKSILTIGPNSEVAISFFAPASQESVALLDVIAGIARLTVNKATSWGRFDVRTTTAVASVRGTDYLVEYVGEKTAVFVAEGRVAVSSRAGSGTVIVRDGQGVDVPAQRAPLNVKIWGAKRRDEGLARVTFP